AEPLLTVSGLSAGYGKIGVLYRVDLTVKAGEVVALLGPNGAGKTTLLRAISGLLPWSGQVRFGGRDFAGADRSALLRALSGLLMYRDAVRFAGRDFAATSPRDIVKAGLAHVIEGHRVFTQLTVLDNLLLAAYDLPRGERAARVEEVLDLFPE